MPSMIDYSLWKEFIARINLKCRFREIILDSYCDQFMNNFIYYAKTSMDTLYMMISTFEDGEEVLVDEKIFENIDFAILENVDYRILKITEDMYDNLPYKVLNYLDIE